MLFEEAGQKEKLLGQAVALEARMEGRYACLHAAGEKYALFWSDDANRVAESVESFELRKHSVFLPAPPVGRFRVYDWKKGRDGVFEESLSGGHELNEVLPREV